WPPLSARCFQRTSGYFSLPFFLLCCRPKRSSGLATRLTKLSCHGHHEHQPFRWPPLSARCFQRTSGYFSLPFFLLCCRPKRSSGLATRLTKLSCHSHHDALPICWPPLSARCFQRTSGYFSLPFFLLCCRPKRSSGLA